MCASGDSVSKKCEVSVDTIQAHEELKALEIQSEVTRSLVIEDVRKGWSALTLFLDIFHIALPESLNLLAAGAFMSAEMFKTLGAAETLTGVLAAKAIFTFTAASMMFYRAIALQFQASEIEQSISSTIQLIDLVSR